MEYLFLVSWLIWDCAPAKQLAWDHIDLQRYAHVLSEAQISVMEHTMQFFAAICGELG